MIAAIQTGRAMTACFAVASAAVGGKPRLEDGNRGESWNTLEPQVVVEEHEWVRLTCANGAAGWILYDEIGNAPGFSSPDECGYGCAEDRKPGDGPSPEKSPSDTFPPDSDEHRDRKGVKPQSSRRLLFF